MGRTFIYRHIETSWGVAVEITAVADRVGVEPLERVRVADLSRLSRWPKRHVDDHEYIRIADLLWLDVWPVTHGWVQPPHFSQGFILSMPVSLTDALFIADGLRVVAPLIADRRPGERLVITVEKIEYNPTDFQDEGLEAAIIGWAAEEFGFMPPPVDVRFDRSRKRYVFHFPDGS